MGENQMNNEEKKNGIVTKEDHNEFELAMRFLGNEIIAIKLAATNFSGKLIVYSILLMFLTFMLMEVFGLSEMFGYGISDEWLHFLLNFTWFVD